MIQHDISLESIKEAIHRYSVKYSARMSVHPNPNVLANQLNVHEVNEVRRLKRLEPSDLIPEPR
jgi:hypothetical protein